MMRVRATRGHFLPKLGPQQCGPFSFFGRELGQYRLRSSRDGSTSADEIARSFKKGEQLDPIKWDRFAIPFDRMLL
jgi:hypothetical protein